MLNRIASWYLTHALGIARILVFGACGAALALAIVTLTLDTSLGLQVSPDATPTHQVASSEDAELTLLRAQLEQMEQTDARLLQTVYWTLATLATVAVLLVGFSWFTNVRLTDRDRQQFRAEMEAALAERVSVVERNLDDRFQALDQRTVQHVSAQLQASERDHQQRFETLLRGVAIAQFGLLETNALSDAASGNFTSVLESAYAMVSIGQGTGFDGAIAHGLELMPASLTQGARPGVELAADINQVLAELDPKYVTDRENVQQLLSSVRRDMGTETGWQE